MYGWRGRIGLLVPSINTTIEPEFWRLAPEGVSVHSARMDVGGQGTPEALRAMEHVAKNAAKDVAMTKPDVVVYGCTSGSFFEGPAFNERIIRDLNAIVKVPVVTTAGAMAASLLAVRDDLEARAFLLMQPASHRIVLGLGQLFALYPPGRVQISISEPRRLGQAAHDACPYHDCSPIDCAVCRARNRRQLPRAGRRQ